MALRKATFLGVLELLHYPSPMIWLQQSNAGDLLSAGFILSLTVLVLLYRHWLTNWARLVGLYLFLLGLQVALPLGSTLGMTPPLLAAFFPVVPVVVIFATLGFIPELNPRDRDASLSWLDRTLFRVDPSVWMDRFACTWITEVMQLAYLAYYVLPFVLLGTLYQRGEQEAFHLCVTALLLSHYLAFIGYMILPALGPRFALASQYRQELKGLLIAVAVRDLLNALEGIKRDAFPSGHTSAILITVFYIVRFTPELSSWSVPIAGLMIFSTVYLRYHYAVDVLAGALLAALCILLAPLLQ
ncbi:MAG: phosphatase PAP2 family protein [Chloroflexi bacterium]|nr:phosphatase PAP2 family protein [Chloroflexota bacterium]